MFCKKHEQTVPRRNFNQIEYRNIMTRRDWMLIGGGICAGALLGFGIPKLSRHLGPIIVEASQRAGDVFSTLAETVATQMERAEDFAAERRASHTSAV